MNSGTIHSHLPRLARSFYQGFAIVHWSMTLQGRKTGWLDELRHARIRERLLHTAVRHALLVPVYCLMPDHLHFLWMGVSEQSDQLKAAEFFRRTVHRVLAPVRFQKQAYDNVLREKDRGRNALEATAWYILENPVRGQMVSSAEQYAYSGGILPGYPDLDVFSDGYWNLFWRVYEE